jgi:hypothetical protein
MFVPRRKTTSKLKAIALIAVITIFLIIYMILFSKSVDFGRILVKFLVMQAADETVELEPTAELPPITRKSAFSVLKTYVLR